MACSSVEFEETERPGILARVQHGVVRWFSDAPRIGQIDPETMPDHLKRDLGLLDGNGPRYEADPRRR